MEEILNFISQNYFYIPASIIAALLIIIPAIVKVAKICTSNTANAVKLALIKKEVEELQTNLETQKTELAESLTEEINYLKTANKYELNKKKVALNKDRIEMLTLKVEKLNEKKVAAEPQETEQPKKKVRIKVKK